MTNKTSAARKDIVIHNIAIPFFPDREVDVLDIETAWKYYPNYVFHARHTRNALSPAQYLMEVLRQGVGHDNRNKMSSDFARYLGSEFFADLDKFDSVYKQYA